MSIRKSTMKDQKRILDLLNSDENLTGDEGIDYEPIYVKEYISGNSFITFVYEDKNKIVGLIIVHVSRIAKYFELNMLVVDKDYRRKGVASKLISFLESYLKKEGYGLGFLYTEEENKAMQKLAQKTKYKKGKKFFFYSKILK